MAKKIVITIGDPAGIGPEITVKSVIQLYKSNQLDLSKVLIVGDSRIIHNCIARVYKSGLSNKTLAVFNKSIIDLHNAAGVITGKTGKACGIAAKQYIDYAVSRILRQSKVSDYSLVTAPVSKKSIISAGEAGFTGHTEYIAKLTGTKLPAMLMLGGKNKYKVLLLTRHIPVNKVSEKLTINSVIGQILVTVDTLHNVFKIKVPEVSICNVNPHCGENGEIGTDEIRVIRPAVRYFSRAEFKNKVSVTGPVLTELAFKQYRSTDLIVTAYHDQAMVPLKLLSGGDIVNYTCGLPFIRTSPGHGTAFDIADKYIADCTSMVSAIKTAM